MSDNDTTAADTDADDERHVRWVAEKNNISEPRARAYLSEYVRQQRNGRDADDETLQRGS